MQHLKTGISLKLKKRDQFIYLRILIPAESDGKKKKKKKPTKLQSLEERHKKNYKKQLKTCLLLRQDDLFYAVWA